MPRPIKRLGEPYQHETDKAAEAITPGHLVTLNASGNLIKHATAAAAARTMFAMEREEAGQGIDVAYEVDDYVKVGVFPHGTRVNAIIASGVNAAKGDALESAGNGTLRVKAAGVTLAYAVEAVNNTTGQATSGDLTAGAARIDAEIA